MKTPSNSETVQFTKGRVVIPARFLRAFQIEDGTYASITATAHGILIKPITRAYIHSMRGSLRGHGVLESLMKSRKLERSP